MKDLKEIVDIYTTVRSGLGRPKAAYICGSNLHAEGHDDEVLAILREKCDTVDPEGPGEYSVGTHSDIKYEVLVLNGEPEAFDHLLDGVQMAVYIGPNTGVRQGFRNTMDWSKKHNIHDLIITPKGAVVYATREVIDALQSNLTVTATTRPPDAVWEDTTTTPEPVLDDPEPPVNTTPPPRDFFSMGQ